MQYNTRFAFIIFHFFSNKISYTFFNRSYLSRSQSVFILFHEFYFLAQSLFFSNIPWIDYILIRSPPLQYEFSSLFSLLFTQLAWTVRRWRAIAVNYVNIAYSFGIGVMVSHHFAFFCAIVLSVNRMSAYIRYMEKIILNLLLYASYYLFIIILFQLLSLIHENRITAWMWLIAQLVVSRIEPRKVNSSTCDCHFRSPPVLPHFFIIPVPPRLLPLATSLFLSHSLTPLQGVSTLPLTLSNSLTGTHTLLLSLFSAFSVIFCLSQSLSHACSFAVDVFFCVCHVSYVFEYFMVKKIVSAAFNLAILAHAKDIDTTPNQNAPLATNAMKLWLYSIELLLVHNNLQRHAHKSESD